MTESISYKRLNAWQIKLLMVFLMVLNHSEYVYQLVPEDLRCIFIFVSRCVAPVFAYFAVQGILYTRSLRNYCIRLGIWSFIVTAGNTFLGFILTNLASGVLPEEHMFLRVRSNISITLAAGVLCIALIIWGHASRSRIRVLLYCASLLCFIVGFISEWGVVLLPFMMVTYFLREKRQERYIGYVVVEIIAILFRSEIYYFLAFPFIALYNGKRGPSGNFNKYFFYIFYPLHLWLIAVINFFLLSR